MSVCSIKNQDPDPIYVLRSGPVNITTLKFCTIDEKDVLISGSQEGLIQFWDLKTKRSYIDLQAGDNASVLYADILPTPKRTLISHDRNGCVKFWDATNLNNMEPHTIWHVNKVGFCPVNVLEYDSNFWIAFPTDDSNIGICPFNIDRTERKVMKEMKPAEKLGMVMQLKLFVRQNTLYVLISYEDGSLRLWDVMLESMKNFIRLYEDPIMALDIDKAALKIITGSVTNEINTISIDQNFEMNKTKSFSSPSSGFSAACVRADNKIAVVGGWDGKLRIFGWKKMKLLAVLKYHLQIISIVCYSKDNVIAAASKDGKISLWDVYKNS